jgi:hypothetical protein
LHSIVCSAAGLLLCAQCWQAMAAAAAGMGDTEVAYCLYAKGYQQCHTALSSSSAAAATAAAEGGGLNAAVQAVVQQLAAGKLQMLAALCQVPDCTQQQQQQQQTCKRWQCTMERFQLTAATTSSSSSSSRSVASSRVFCVSDLHVDKAGGANMAWLKRISSSAFRNDVLIVAGGLAGITTSACTAQCSTVAAICHVYI